MKFKTIRFIKKQKLINQIAINFDFKKKVQHK